MADIDCSLLDVTPEQAFRKILAMGADNCPAFRIIEVEPLGDICDNFIDCDNTEMDWRTLFFRAIDITDDCWSVKVVVAT